MPEVRSDEQLVAAYLSGDKPAFEEIVERYDGRLFIFAWDKLRHHQDAQDAVQDTWFKTWQSLASFDDTHKFSSWLYKICQNFCFMKMRERGRNRFTAFSDLPDKIEKLKPGPIKEVAESMEVRFRILAVLTHEEHKLWELVVTKGWKYEAIAQDEKLFRGKTEEELRTIFGQAWRKVWEQRNKEVAKWVPKKKSQINTD
ncbi:MAG: sigma-70 family RNA polymerase sigma factor [Planctomycetes bacterium]|nr:sigma-70 family RNA polymerase sigma factor [Planctomycetota bacterium]